MVAVVGISQSSRADVVAQLDALGTDLLRVAPGQTAFGEETTLPESARDTVARIGPVTDAAGVTYVSEAVRRNDHISESVTGGIAVVAADLGVLDAVSGELRDRPLPRRRVERAADRRARRRRREPPRHRRPRRRPAGVARRPVVRRDRHPRAGAAGARPRQRGADRLPGRRRAVRDDHVAVDAVRAHGARAGRGGARRAGPHRRPADARRGRRVPTVRRPGGPGDDRRRAAQPAARPRRRRPRRRRRRHHERDGDLGARTAQRDRRAPRPRRPPRPRRRPVPRRGRRARDARRRRRRGARRRRHGAVRHVARAGSSTCRSRPSPAAPPPRSPSACSPASPPPSAPPASTPPTPSARSDVAELCVTASAARGRLR